MLKRSSARNDRVHRVIQNKAVSSRKNRNLWEEFSGFMFLGFNFVGKFFKNLSLCVWKIRLWYDVSQGYAKWANFSEVKKIKFMELLDSGYVRKEPFSRSFFTLTGSWCTLCPTFILFLSTLWSNFYFQQQLVQALWLGLERKYKCILGHAQPPHSSIRLHTEQCDVGISQPNLTVITSHWFSSTHFRIFSSIS